MSHRVRSIVCIAFVLLFAAAGRLEAQTCNGYGSIHTGPWQLSVGGLWNNASDRFLAYLQHAWGNAIAGGGYSVTSVDKVDQKVNMVFGGAGYEAPLEPTGRIVLCGGAELGYIMGPDIPPAQVRGTAAEVTARLGVVLIKTAGFQLIPNAAISGTRTNLTAKVGTQEASTASNAGIATFAAGFVFGDRFALVPTYLRQLDQSNGPNSFSVFLAITMGGR